MVQTLICSNGHRWNASNRDPRSSRLKQCPACGGSAMTAPPESKIVASRGVVAMKQRASIARPAPITPVKIELTPDLPVPDFVSTYSWTPERIGALAIYCSDGRWGDAFDEFCHRRLNIPRYDRFAVPGGAAWITESTQSELRRAAHAQLEFLVRVHELKRIVLITHWGCRYYTDKHAAGAREAFEHQKNDVHTAARTLREWFKGISVDCYLAMQNGRLMSFHQLREATAKGR